MATTFQSNIKRYDDENNWIQNYSLFLGGLNTTHNAIKQYDPLRPGRARIFFVQMPVFMDRIMPEETKRIKHLFEYGFKKVDGIGNISLETDKITGGYTAREFEVPTLARDETSEISIGLYEFAGSPISEWLQMCITGICDPITGFGTYHGATDASGNPLRYNQANHSMEAVYLVTDPTGRSDSIEYACLLTNMVPKNVKKDHFNYNAGESPMVELDVVFSCNKYESPQINALARGLNEKYKILKDSLNFRSGYRISNTGVKSEDNHQYNGAFTKNLDDMGGVLTEVPNWGKVE